QGVARAALRGSQAVARAAPVPPAGLAQREHGGPAGRGRAEPEAVARRHGVGAPPWPRGEPPRPSPDSQGLCARAQVAAQLALSVAAGAADRAGTAPAASLLYRLAGVAVAIDRILQHAGLLWAP